MRISTTAIAFARTAANEAASASERDTAAAKLAAYCAKHNVTPEAIAEAVTASETVKRQPLTETQAAAVDAARNPKPVKPVKPVAKPKAAKPEAEPVKPAKPADTSKADALAARERIVNELRASVSALYNGPSLAVRSNPKRIAASVYSSLFDAPKHRTTLDRVSVRDESALREIVLRGTAGRFDPSALNLDSGIFSRLASVAFIERDGDGFALSKAGLTHARAVTKRAA